MQRQVYKYEVMLAGVVVYQCQDNRDTDEVISIIKRGLKHIFEDEELKDEVEIFKTAVSEMFDNKLL